MSDPAQLKYKLLLKESKDVEIDEPFDLLYIDPPFFTQRDFGEFNDEWESLEFYLHFLTESLDCIPSDAKDFNLIVHVDPRTSHYVKVALDKKFGYSNFSSEIIWKYNSGGAGRKRLAQKHDTLLHYKIGEAPFNVIREPYATPNVLGRKGFHADGRMLTDVWDIPIISTTGKERNGYPTQKPLALLKRVVEVFSNKGGLIVDTFCGSGTTGEAAVSLGRRFLGADINQNALDITESRLKKY